MTRIVIPQAFILLYCLLTLLSQPLQAEIYRWVDKQGQTHFSDADNKPDHINNARQITVEPNVIQVRPGLQPRQNRSQQTTKPASQTKPVDRITRIEQDRNQCNTARENLKKVRQQMRAGYTVKQYRRLHDREIRYMDDRHRYCR